MTVAVAPVKKSITVNCSQQRAFEVFTRGIDTWWPRSHHIGSSPLEEQVIEPRTGGRCFGRSTDGTECDWGRVLAWDPPHRLVVAWQLTPDYKYQPDVAQASEVDVRFLPTDDGRTHVELEHRYLERHGAGGEAMRASVGSDNGWSGLLRLYDAEVSKEDSERMTTRYAGADPTAAASPVIAPLAMLYRINDSLVSRAFTDVSDDEAWARHGGDRANSMLWILAHAITVRNNVTALLGTPTPLGWGRLFVRGSSVDPDGSYPSRQEIMDAHQCVAGRIRTGLAALTDQDAAREIGDTGVPLARTLGEHIAFYAMHDSYHVGQLGILRRLLNKKGLVG